MMNEVVITMSRSAYADMLKLDGIKSKDGLLKHINDTWGLLGTVTDVLFDDDVSY